MKQRILYPLLVCLGLFLLTGCGTLLDETMLEYEDGYNSYSESLTDAPDTTADAPTTVPETTAAPETEAAEQIPETEAAAEAETEAATDDIPDEDGVYTSAEDVAEYLYIYGELPDNFLTKKEAKEMGWVSSEGNLWEVAPGMSIGGDYFGNYEGQLPEGHYTECDINYDGGYRGSERLIFDDEGNIYYTDDHYETFTKLY